MALDSTHELLSNYQSTHDDNLSLYSISGELNHQFSDLYDMLDNDSIEIRRSQSITESPFKTSSPLKFSPTKKLRNDYQDHIFRARSGNQESPVKKRLGTEWPKLDLDDTDTYDSIEKNIDQFLAGNSEKLGKIETGLDELDKTELIIKETHKLINNVPLSVVNNKEGEKYSKMLGSSLSKIIKSLETVKKENLVLKADKDKFYDQLHQEKVRSDVAVTRLQAQNSKLEENVKTTRDEARRTKIENTGLKEQIEQLNRKLSQQVPQINSLVKRENTLLREKLIKYKNLSTELQQEIDQLKGQTEEKHTKSKQNPEPNGKKNYDFEQFAQFFQQKQSEEIQQTKQDSIPDQETKFKQSNIVDQFSEYLQQRQVARIKQESQIVYEFAQYLDEQLQVNNQKERDIVQEFAQYVREQESKTKPSKMAQDSQLSRNSQPDLVQRLAPHWDHKLAKDDGIVRNGQTEPSPQGQVSATAPPKSYTYKLLPLFEELIHNMKEERSRHDPQVYDPHLFDRLMSTVDVNNELYARLFDRDGISTHGLEKPGNGQDPAQGSTPRNRAKEPGCRVCNLHSASSEVFTASEGMAEPAQGCPRCKNDTFQLMGEYKWSI